MSTDLDDAWSDLHDATPAGWYVGRPFDNERDREWEQHTFDSAEKAKVGVRSREWTAQASTGGSTRRGVSLAA